MSETQPAGYNDYPENTAELLGLAREIRPFVAEVLVSSGPRKSPYEYEQTPHYAELCEDCAGTCWIGERLVFWLCDGASNGMVLLPLSAQEGEAEPPQVFGFNTRILAKELGQAFVEYLCDILPGTPELKTLPPPTPAINTLVNSWDERFRTYVSRIEQRGKRENLRTSLPQTRDGINTVTWSSTFLGGVYDPLKRCVCVVNYGDCGGLLFTSPQKTIIVPNENPVRLSAEIEPSETLMSNIRLAVDHEEEWEYYTDVAGFTVMSDGIDRTLCLMLQQLQEKDFNTLSKLRLELLRSATVSWDDKSIVFGRFLGG